MKDKMYKLWSVCAEPLLQAFLIGCLLVWIAIVPYQFIVRGGLSNWLIPAIYGALFPSACRWLRSLLEIFNERPKI